MTADNPQDESTIDRRAVLKATGASITAGTLTTGAAGDSRKNPNEPTDSDGPRRPDVRVLDNSATDRPVVLSYETVPGKTETERQTLDTVTLDTLGTNSEQLQARLAEAVADDGAEEQGSIEDLLADARAEIDRLSLGYVGQVRVVAEHAGHSASAVINVGTDGGYSDETVLVTIDTDGHVSAHTDVAC
jgi:hypothetical protein